MPLAEADRRYIVETAVQILRHPRRERLLALLEQRLENGDYADEGELELDRVVRVLARTIDESLVEPG